MRKLAALLLFILCLVSCACAEEEYQTVETEHFTILAPKAWTENIDENSGIIYLLENPFKGISQGDGAILISETPFAFDGLSTEEFYNLYIDELTNNAYPTNIQIDHQDAIYFQDLMKIGYNRYKEVHVAVCALPSENVVFIIRYIRSKSDNQRGELINLLRGVNRKSPLQK